MHRLNQTILAGAIVSMACLPALAQTDIVIGSVGPLTGSVALSGEQLNLGAQRAVSDLNDAGGVLGRNIRLIPVDDACDVDQALAAANHLVTQNVVAVIGHLCSRTSIFASEIYEKAGIVMISPASTNPLVTDRGLSGVFRTIGRDDAQAEVAADFIMSRFPDVPIALLHDGNTYGQELVEGVQRELNAMGRTEALITKFEAEQDSYLDTVAEVNAVGAKVVYAVGNAIEDAALIVRQLKESNPEINVISADTMAGDGFSLIAGSAAKGTFFTFGPDARLNAEAAEVVERFRDEEAYEPAGYTLNSYAAVQAWAQAVEVAENPDPGAVSKVLRSETFNTVLGEIGFDEKGDIVGVESFIMYVWGDAQYEPAR